jgi:hypothetical protein
MIAPGTPGMRLLGGIAFLVPYDVAHHVQYSLSTVAVVATIAPSGCRRPDAGATRPPAWAYGVPPAPARRSCSAGR